MKILDEIARIGDAFGNITLSHTHDSTNKIHSKDEEKPIFLWHTEGTFSTKVLKLVVSAAIVAGGCAIAKAVKKSKQG